MPFNGGSCFRRLGRKIARVIRGFRVKHQNRGLFSANSLQSSRKSELYCYPKLPCGRFTMTGNGLSAAEICYAKTTTRYIWLPSVSKKKSSVTMSVYSFQVVSLPDKPLNVFPLIFLPFRNFDTVAVRGNSHLQFCIITPIWESEYKAQLKGGPQLWWILSLLLLATSAWLSLQHSRNLENTFLLSPVELSVLQRRRTYGVFDEIRYCDGIFCSPRALTRCLE